MFEKEPGGHSRHDDDRVFENIPAGFKNRVKDNANKKKL
jgi:hypothetical protein